MFLFLVGTNCFLPWETMFCIDVKPLCYHHCLCLLIRYYYTSLAWWGFWICCYCQPLAIENNRVIFTVSMWSSSILHCSGSFSLLWNSCISPASAYFSEVINIATVHTLLSIGWELPGWMAGTAIIPALLFRQFGMCFYISPIVSEFPFYYLYLVRLFCFS